MSRWTLAALCVIAGLAVAIAIYLSIPRGSTFDLGGDASPITKPELVKAEKVALQVWGEVCGGQVAVSIAPLAGKQVGRSTWLVVPGSPGRQWCAVVIDDRELSYRQMCAVLTHEYGHLAGFHDPSNTEDPQHSANPRSVMFPRLTANNVPARCQTQ